MNYNTIRYKSLLLVFAFSLTIGTIKAQDKPAESDADLAKKLSNPGNFEITQNWQGNSTAVYFNPTITGITITTQS